jgi:hydrogenase/urease accessory protein HupE
MKVISAKFCKLIFSIALILLVSIPINSHPLSVSYAEFIISDHLLEVRYRLPMDDMDLLLGLDSDLDEIVSAEEIYAASERLNSYIHEQVTVEINDTVISHRLISMDTWLDSDEFPYLEIAVEYTSQNAILNTKIQLRFLSDLYPDHRILASLVLNDVSNQFVFQHSNIWEWERDKQSVLTTAFEFFIFGLEHIVTGYDHLMFLLALLIVSRGLKNLVIIVTSFTVAHSITLALATLGLIHPVGWIVESAIALSILYVGLENLLVEEVKHRWRLTFTFGLIHGFGFAGLLDEMDLDRAGLLLSLFSFNLGVETGQIAIVALTWPLLNSLAKTKFRKPIVNIVSGVISVFGLVWFVQRAIL